MLNLDRATLAKITQGDARAIRALESILKYVGETGPEALEDILALLNGQRHNNTSMLEARVSDLETLLRRTSNLSAVTARVGDVEQMPPQRANLSAVLARLDAIEAAVSQRTNLSAILRRLENLEKITGV